MILLMVQESGVHQLRLVVYHSLSHYLQGLLYIIFYRFQLVQDFFQQQYFICPRWYDEYFFHQPASATLKERKTLTIIFGCVMGIQGNPRNAKPPQK